MKQLLPQRVLCFSVTSNQDLLSSSTLLGKYGHESQDVTALMSSLRPQIKIVHKPMGDVGRFILGSSQSDQKNVNIIV